MMSSLPKVVKSRDTLRRKNSFGRNLRSLAGISNLYHEGEDEEDPQEEPAAAELNQWVFEVAWEVANKVGGIYTVIRTKAAETVAELGDQYCLLGPYNEKCANLEVELLDLPTESGHPITTTIRQMRQHNINVKYGRWLIDGHPKVVLFDVGSAAHKLEEWRGELYEKAHMGIPWADSEANDCTIFGFLVCWFVSEFRQCVKPQPKPQVLAHFHEWMSGVGLVMLRTSQVDVATIFTTHATLLGRFLCAGDTDFYNNLDKFDTDKEAGDRGIYHRYCVERAASHCAHVFTTVSQITAIESEYLVKRKPDCITPNGLNVTKFSALHEFQNLHSKAKMRIHEFVKGHFHGHLDFDLEKTLYLFTAGRYEFINKGADLFIESLARLNYIMQKNKSEMTVVAFLIFPAKTSSFNVESLKGQAIAKQVQETVSSIKGEVGQRILDKILKGHLPSSDELLSDTNIVDLKRILYSAQTSNLPPICTHNVCDDHKDPILSAVRRVKLFNNRHDRVKIVFHPEFLSSTNPLIGLSYDDFVRGCNMGVFPSYYEPWGYTPAECTVMGIPSVTTNLSGFGSFIMDHVTDPPSYGLFIIDRRFQSGDDSVNQLTHVMHDFTRLTQRQRIIMRNRTERLSDILDWKSLGIYYKQARQLCLQKVYPDLHPSRCGEINGLGTRVSGESFGKLSRPQSYPSTPISSRAPSPTSSTPGYCSMSQALAYEEDSADSDAELEALQMKKLNI